jgi:cysteine desulfurase
MSAVAFENRRPGAVRETYLDWNATAPPRAEASAAVADALVRWGNPSSVHRRGRAARQMIEHARETIAALISGVDPAGMIFVGGGTEANNLALRGTGRDRILVSAVEHDSVIHAAPTAEAIPVDHNGVLRLDALDWLLAADPRPSLVSVMFANNETGVIQPVAEIAALARRYGALFHCDAVQAAGKLPLHMDLIGADLITLSAHKLGGPLGIGALVATRELDLLPLLRGGGQERGRRAGTENLPGIAGFAAAASTAATEIAVYERVAALRDELEARIATLAPGAIVIGASVPRLPNTSALAMPGIPAETQVIALDLDGVMVSAGAACSSGKVGPSHVLAAMGIEPVIAASTIRVSLGWSSCEDDIANFLRAWTALGQRRRGFAEGVRAA